jgi:hypothetical protein
MGEAMKTKTKFALVLFIPVFLRLLAWYGRRRSQERSTLQTLGAVCFGRLVSHPTLGILHQPC